MFQIRKKVLIFILILILIALVAVFILRWEKTDKGLTDNEKMKILEESKSETNINSFSIVEKKEILKELNSKTSEAKPFKSEPLTNAQKMQLLQTVSQ